jgi:hypothetical protein
MMQAGIRVKITATSGGVTDLSRDEPMPPGAISQGDLMDKADFRPTPSGRLKEFTAIGGVVLRARAPKWALNPITARAIAPTGSIVLTKMGGDPHGEWASIGIRPIYEWCLVLPEGVRLTSEPSEIKGMLVAFLPNGGDIDENVRRVIGRCTIADVDRVRAIYSAGPRKSEKADKQRDPGDRGDSTPPPVSGPDAPPSPPPLPPRAAGGTPGAGSPSAPPRGGPPASPPPRIAPPRPTS